MILLPIEAESQDTALRIFSTLNDRGLPLADADIFKSQFYKHFSGEGRKDEFVTRWKALEETANLIFKPTSGTPLDELFTRYMYYRRAKKGIRDTTTKSLRDFYSDSSYQILREDATLDDLESLLDFWKRVDALEGFSERVARRLFVLNYAPNGMWAYLLSTWFLAKRNAKGELDDKELYDFLCYITGFIYAYSLERPGVNALRGPVYPALIDIVEGRKVDFSAHLFDRETITGRFRSYQFTNQRRFTRSMLVWWAYSDPKQSLMDLDTTLEIEHIYARKRNEVHPLSNRSNLEALGNKAMLEKRVNIRASDYQLSDKRKYYEDCYSRTRGNCAMRRLRRERHRNAHRANHHYFCRVAWQVGPVKGVKLNPSSLVGLGPGKARSFCSVDGRCRLLRLCAKRWCQHPGKGVWPPPGIFSYHAETIGDDHMDTVARKPPSTLH